MRAVIFIASALLAIAVLPTGAAAAPSVYVTLFNGNATALFDAAPDGALAPQAPPTLATGGNPDGIEVSPDGNSLYVVRGSPSANNIAQYDIGADGRPVPKDPATVAAGSGPSRIAFSPDGTSAYVTNNSSGTVSQYDVGADGSLSPKSPATVASDTGPYGVAVAPDGSSVYVTNSNFGQISGGTITQYDAGAGGALSPKTPASIPAGYFPGGIAVAPDGDSLYTTELNSIFVRQWDAAANGTLSPKDPATVPAGQFPTELVISPDGASVYVTNQETDNISQYDVGAGGKLSAKTAATVPAGDNPNGIAIDAAGDNVYVVEAGATGRDLRHYTVGSDGSLVVSGDPIDLDGDAADVAIRNDTTPPLVAINSGPTGTTPSRDASFAFSANESGSTFKCRLDDAPFSPCSSPHSYAGLGFGPHTFAVQATDPWANTSTTATRQWTVEGPPNNFAFGSVKRDKGRGTALLEVRAESPGGVDLAGTATVKPRRTRIGAAGSATVLVKARGKAKRKLNRRGRAQVVAKVTYTPDGGSPRTQAKKLTLKKRLR